MTDINTTSLVKQLAEVDSLVKNNTITEERGKVWKQRIIDKFESESIPAEIQKPILNDLSHLPGRMIAGAIDFGKAFAKGAGATYEGLSRQEGYDPRTGDPVERPRTRTRQSRDPDPQNLVSSRRAKSPQQLMDELPDMYK